MQQVRVTLEGGGSHPVDSSDVAFRLAAVGAFRQAFAAAAPVVLEPHMLVEVRAPLEYQGSIMGDLNRRRGMILDSGGEADEAVITAQVCPGPPARTPGSTPLHCLPPCSPCLSLFLSIAHGLPHAMCHCACCTCGLLSVRHPPSRCIAIAGRVVLSSAFRPAPSAPHHVHCRMYLLRPSITMQNLFSRS